MLLKWLSDMQVVPYSFYMYLSLNVTYNFFQCSTLATHMERFFYWASFDCNDDKLNLCVAFLTAWLCVVGDCLEMTGIPQWIQRVLRKCTDNGSNFRYSDLLIQCCCIPFVLPHGFWNCCTCALGLRVLKTDVYLKVLLPNSVTCCPLFVYR